MSTQPVPQSFQLIPILALRECQKNPRRRFDEKGLAELTESIRTHGVLTPLLARPVDGHFEVAAGHRRLRAAAKAGLAELPCIVREMTDEQLLEVLTIENLQREDVHPIEEAAGYAELLKIPGWDVARIAERVSKSASYVYQRLRLAALTERVREAFYQGALEAGHAILIARLPAVAQLQALDQFERISRYGPRMSVRDLEAWIERQIYHDLATAPWKLEDCALVEGKPCTLCTKRTGALPELADGRRGDHCLDRECWERKHAAHLARVKEAHPGAAELSQQASWNVEVKGALDRDKWRPVKPGEQGQPGVKVGILIDGPNAGQVAHYRDAGPEKRSGGASKAITAKEEAEKAEQQRLVALGDARVRARTKVLDQILAKVTALATADLRLVAAQLAERWTEEIFERHGWKLKGVPDAKNIAEHIPRLSDRDLAKLIVEACLIEHIDGWSTRREQQIPVPLAEAARRYKVDAVAIEAAEIAALEASPGQTKPKALTCGVAIAVTPKKPAVPPAKKAAPARKASKK